MSMRCFMPACRSMLVDLVEGPVEGRPVPAGTRAYAVTPALLAATGADGPEDEEAEYAALMLAAEASVLLLDRAEPADRRRVVLAVDAEVDRSGADDAPGEVRLQLSVHRDNIASIHVDTDDPGGAAALVDRAVTARDTGDDAGLEQALVELADVHLEWYAPSELDSLV